MNPTTAAKLKRAVKAAQAAGLTVFAVQPSPAGWLILTQPVGDGIAAGPPPEPEEADDVEAELNRKLAALAAGQPATRQVG